MNDKFDLLMAFPKYRRLVNRLKVVNRDNRNLRKNWEQQVRKNENIDKKLERSNSLIKDLRKEIEGLKLCEKRNKKS